MPRQANARKNYMVSLAVHPKNQEWEGMNISFFCPGECKTKGSFRALVSKSTGRAFLIPTSKDKAWQQRVSLFAAQAMAGHPPATDCAVNLHATFFLERPKAHYRTGSHADELRDDAPKRPFRKPDRDKLERSVCDALTGIVYGDDAQIVGGQVEKRYADLEHPPGVQVTVEGGVTPTELRELGARLPRNLTQDCRSAPFNFPPAMIKRALQRRRMRRS